MTRFSGGTSVTLLGHLPNRGLVDLSVFLRRYYLERLIEKKLIELVLKRYRPDKTLRTSSDPSASVRKKRHEKSRSGGTKPGHGARERALISDLDQVVEHQPISFSACGESLLADLPADLISVDDGIDQPLVRPVVEQHQRLCVTCLPCRTRVAAPAHNRLSPPCRRPAAVGLADCATRPGAAILMPQPGLLRTPDLHRRRP